MELLMLYLLACFFGVATLRRCHPATRGRILAVTSFVLCIVYFLVEPLL